MQDNNLLLTILFILAMVGIILMWPVVLRENFKRTYRSYQSFSNLPEFLVKQLAKDYNTFSISIQKIAESNNPTSCDCEKLLSNLNECSQQLYRNLNTNHNNKEVFGDKSGYNVFDHGVYFDYKDRCIVITNQAKTLLKRENTNNYKRYLLS